MARKRKIYDLWIEYDNFLRSLHLETLEEQSAYSRRKRFFNYLKRLPIILFASLLTTLTFQFFINPNKLFNSGLSGVIQVVTNYFFTKSGVAGQNRAVCYYAVVVLVNVLIVSIVQFFYQCNFEVNSTAIFYVLFQFFWSSVFRRCSLQNYFFSRFSAQSWSNSSSLNQSGLTLPFYITIAVVSAIIHTYGYSLIYRAKSTPGGFEIVTSTLLAQNKGRKVSVGSLNRLFSIFVIFFITIFNFLLVNDNVQFKKEQLIELINSNIYTLDKHQERIKSVDDLDLFIKRYYEKNYFSCTENISVRGFLKDWSEDHRFEELPNGIWTYFEKDEQILRALSNLEEEKKNIIRDLSVPRERGIERLQKEGPSSFPVLTRGSMIPAGKTDKEKKHTLKTATCSLSHIRLMIEKRRKNTYEKNLLGYFKYITNDEKLWASLIYIFFSSYLINQIFPKSKVVLLTALLEDDDNLAKILKVLQKYNPNYFRVFSKKENKEQEVYFLTCPITKWDYQLLAGEINRFGKVLVSKLDE